SLTVSPSTYNNDAGPISVLTFSSFFDPVAEAAQQIFILTPIFENFDTQFKVNLRFHQLFNIGTGRAANLLEHSAALANEDAFLRIALHVDVRRDVGHRAAAFLELSHLDGYAVRNFLLRVEQYLFPDVLGGNVTQGCIAELVFG